MAPWPADADAAAGKALAAVVYGERHHLLRPTLANAALVGDVEWCAALLPETGRQRAALAALRLACHAPKDAVVAFLLDHGADVDDSRFSGPATGALVNAVRAESAGMVRRLLDAGVDVGSVLQADVVALLDEFEDRVPANRAMDLFQQAMFKEFVGDF